MGLPVWELVHAPLWRAEVEQRDFARGRENSWPGKDRSSVDLNWVVCGLLGALLINR